MEKHCSGKTRRQRQWRWKNGICVIDDGETKMRKKSFLPGNLMP
jgi:hypothetical protein